LSTADFNYIIHRFWYFEEFPDQSLVEKRHTEDTKHIKGASVKLEIMLNNSNKAIGCDSRINLDSDRIFGYAPERLYMQMLLDPLKEQLHLPSILVYYQLNAISFELILNFEKKLNIRKHS